VVCHGNRQRPGLLIARFAAHLDGCLSGSSGALALGASTSMLQLANRGLRGADWGLLQGSERTVRMGRPANVRPYWQSGRFDAAAAYAREERRDRLGP
jgi:hypothetical protein